MLKCFCWIIMAALCSCSGISRMKRRLRNLESKFSADVGLLRDDMITERKKREKLELILREYIPLPDNDSSAVTSATSEGHNQRLMALEQRQSEMERSFEDWKSNEQTKTANLESELENSTERIQALSSQLSEKTSNFNELLESVQALKIQTEKREVIFSRLQRALSYEKAQRYDLRLHLDRRLQEKTNAIRHHFDQTMLEKDTDIRERAEDRITQLDKQLEEIRSVQIKFGNDICEAVPESDEKDSCGTNSQSSTGKAFSCCLRSGFAMLERTLGSTIPDLKYQQMKSRICAEFGYTYIVGSNSQSCFKFSDNYMKQTAAQAKCERDGAHLLRIDSQSELEMFSRYWDSRIDRSYGYYYIDGKYSIVNDNVLLSNGRIIRYSNHTFWYSNSRVIGRHCMSISPLKLSPIPCIHKWGSICERDV